jgi:hypothetical protein
MDVVTNVFERLRKAKNIDEIDKALDDSGLTKYRLNDITYPKIEFRITKEEIEELKEKKIIVNDQLSNNLKDADTLSKLLYAALWKNGDLKKLTHIIQGISSEKEDHANSKDSGLIFYQFGRYLTKKQGEPIVDQHVLRAYACHKNKDMEEIDKVEKIKEIEKLFTSKNNKNLNKLIQEYKNWRQTGLAPEICNNDECYYHVDKVLFAVGKYIKRKYILNHKQKNNNSKTIQ